MGYLHDLLLRICEVEIEAMSPVKVDAKPFFPYSQEAFPYFYNQLAEGTYSQENGMDYVFQTRRVNAYLVIAHLTEGYRGDAQEKADDYIPKVIEGFTSMKGSMLVSDAYPNRASYLLDAVRVVSDTGIRLFTNGGLQDQLQIGVQFVLELTLIRRA